MWHAQVTSLTLRLYEEPGGYEARAPYVATAQIEILGAGVAYVHSMLTRDGTPMSIPRLLELAALLRRDWGITELLAERHGRMLKIPTER